MSLAGIHDVGGELGLTIVDGVGISARLDGRSSHENCFSASGIDDGFNCRVIDITCRKTCRLSLKQSIR